MKDPVQAKSWLALFLLAFLNVGCPASFAASQRCNVTWPEDAVDSTNQSPSALLQRGSYLQYLESKKAKAVSETEVWLVDHEGFDLKAPRRGSTLANVASSLSAASNMSNISKRAGVRAITFITVHDPFFATNLGTSPLWLNRDDLPHQWILLDNSVEKKPISNMYARAQASAIHELLVFLHPDIILPEEFYQGFMQKLDMIEAANPNWGVLGTAGVPQDYPKNGTTRVAASITDCMGVYRSGVDSLPVQALDEQLLVLRRNSSLSFDIQFPGFDLYGMDIVMSARKMGMVSYLLNLPIRHKTIDVDGQKYDAAIFHKKVIAPEYLTRLRTSVAYFRQKWCDSGLLPVYGTSFQVDQPNDCSL